MKVYSMWGKAPSRSDFKWAFSLVTVKVLNSYEYFRKPGEFEIKYLGGNKNAVCIVLSAGKRSSEQH